MPNTTKQQMNYKLLIILLFPLLSYGQIATDKKLHFVAGAGISFVTYATVYSITKDRQKAKIYSVLSALGAGIIKEVIDERKYNGFDSKDILATTLGGLTFTYSIDLLAKRKKKTIF